MIVTCIRNIFKHGFLDRFFHLSDFDIIFDLKTYNLLVLLSSSQRRTSARIANDNNDDNDDDH